MPDTAPAATPEPNGDERLLRIGEVAKRCGVSVRTIRYYQEFGLVSPHSVTAGRYRLFNEAEVARIEKIGRLKDLMGLSLEEIRAVLDLDDRLDEMNDAALRIADLPARIPIATAYLGLLNRQRNLVVQRRRELDDYVDDLERRISNVIATIEQYSELSGDHAASDAKA